MIFCLHKLSILHHLRDIPHLRFRLVTLTCQVHRRSYISPFFGKPTWDLYNDLPLIRTLYLVPFARYSASKISINDFDLSGSPKVKYFTFSGKADMGLYNDLLLIWTLFLVLFVRYSASKILVCDFDLSGSPKVKYFTFSGKPIWDFIMNFCWYELSSSYRLWDILHLRFWLMTLTFQGHQRSNISTFLETSHVTL